MLVVAVGGFWPHAVNEAAWQLAGDNPAIRLLEAGSGPAGDLVAALAPELARGGYAMIVLLSEEYEPDQLRAAWRAQEVTAGLHVVTAVPGDLVLDGLTDETVLGGRTVSDLVCRQLEQADTVLLSGQPDGADGWETEQLRLLLRRIAPWARHEDLGSARMPAGAGHSEPVVPLLRGLHGRDLGVDEPTGSHDVTAAVFRSRRPFHPERLHRALGEVTGQTLRSRGHFWLASRPDVVLSWESATKLTVAPAGVWLADLPDDQWDGVHPERRLAAGFDWDPYYGDRHQHLAFVGLGLDTVRLHAVLETCLLTDDEIIDGEQAWRAMPDPFARNAIGHATFPPD